jgi:AraC-like DNA-binding protein/CheY-like chemotaxis protein
MHSLLIADDEQLEREVLRLFVEDSHLEISRVLESASGTEAVKTCLLEKPDIVLMDINMPGMSGLEVLERIRVADKRCKVIISSAYGYFEYAKKAMQLGVLDFLVKPVKQEVLVAALNKAVDILDAEAEAADRLSRMAGMVESMGARVAADLAGGTVAEEDLYYLDSLGLRPDSAGATFHVRPAATWDARSGAEAAREARKLLSLLGLPPLCAVKDGGLLLVVFADPAGDLGAKSLRFLRSGLSDIQPGCRIGCGPAFDHIDAIRSSYAAARGEAGEPDAQPEAAPADRDIPSLIEKVQAYIEENYARKIGLDDIAEAVGSSKYHVCRVFKQGTGTTIVDYLVARRIGKAKELLKDGSHSIKQISALVGYSDPNYFTWTFKKREGISPVGYRYAEGGENLK